MMNLSGKWYLLSKSGTVVEGADHPEGASVLAAPGGNVPQDVVDKYDLADRLKGPEQHQVDSVGRPIVHTEDGRAVSIDLLGKDHPVRKKVEASLADRPKTADAAPVTTKPGTTAATIPPKV